MKRLHFSQFIAIKMKLECMQGMRVCGNNDSYCGLMNYDTM